jgi:hypothetical protein
MPLAASLPLIAPALFIYLFVWLVVAPSRCASWSCPLAPLSHLVSSCLAMMSCLIFASRLVIASLLVASHCAHFFRLVVVSSHCISTLRPVITSTGTCRRCITSRHQDALRPITLFCCRILFILLSCYLSQRVDLHPRRTIAAAAQCRRYLQWSPNMPPVPATDATAASSI